MTTTLASWVQRANCTTTDPEAWFAPVGTRAHEIAKKLCDSCEVRSQCDAQATHVNQHWGIWGGKARPSRRTRETTRRTAG